MRDSSSSDPTKELNSTEVVTGIVNRKYFKWKYVVSVPFHETLRHALKAVPGFATILRRRLNGFQVGKMTLAFKIKRFLS